MPNFDLRNYGDLKMKLNAIFAIVIATFIVPAAIHAQESDSILVDEYITSQEFVEATVVNVRSKARTLTVRGEKRGQTRQFVVPEGTRISVNGRDARLRDIRRGDNVLVAMRPRQDEVVVAQLRVPETARTLEERRAEPVAEEVMPTTLPKTASPWPSILTVGMLALFGAGLLRLTNRQ